jgi:hypothetical protein
VVAELLSLRQAGRLSGVSHEALRAAIDDDRLPAWRAQRGYERGRLGTRSHWLIARDALEAFVAGLEPCLYPGCDKPAAARSGCCSGPHTTGVRARGKARAPEVGVKVRAAMTGRERGPNPPEWNEHLAAGIQRFYDDHDRSKEKRREAAERMRHSWETGEGAAPAAVGSRLKAPRARQVWLGRWNGVKGAAAGVEAGRAKGGRPPKATPEQKQEMLRLSNEGLSSRAIAEQVFGDRRFFMRVQRFLNC